MAVPAQFRAKPNEYDGEISLQICSKQGKLDRWMVDFRPRLIPLQGQDFYFKYPNCLFDALDKTHQCAQGKMMLTQVGLVIFANETACIARSEISEWAYPEERNQEAAPLPAPSVQQKMEEKDDSLSQGMETDSFAGDTDTSTDSARMEEGSSDSDSRSESQRSEGNDLTALSLDSPLLSSSLPSIPEEFDQVDVFFV